MFINSRTFSGEGVRLSKLKIFDDKIGIFVKIEDLTRKLMDFSNLNDVTCKGFIY